jgi:hypothetical protein
MGHSSRHWHLYWVASDGDEDCFIVARNSRSAASVECGVNGFDPTELEVTKIMRIPASVERAYKREAKYKEHPWPSYVYGKKFFQKLGAQFRTIDNREEMLLDDVVYAVDAYVPGSIHRERSVGRRAVQELREDAGLAEMIHEYDDEDTWNGPVIHLVTGLGMCVIRCQQIEYYISNSFLLGISKKQKAKYKTINDLREGWRKKTLGNMLQSIEEAWEIEPIVKAGLQLFLEMRNRLVHGLTTDGQFDIRTDWGQRELLAFLYLFDVHSRIVKRAFRASYYAGFHFAIQKWGLPEGSPKKLFTKKQKDEISLFAAFFSPKPGCI